MIDNPSAPKASKSQKSASADVNRAPVWVIGHKNPDTDAICSAIAYADFLQQTRLPEARAACCGPPNSRTDWVLSQAGLQRPQMLVDVRLRADDICQRDVLTAAPDDTVLSAYSSMVNNGHRAMPVLGSDGKIIGMLSLLDLLELLIPIDTVGDKVRQVPTTLANVCRALDAEAVHLTEQLGEEEDFIMMVAGSSEPVMQARVADFDTSRLILITGDRAGVQLLAVEAGVRCLVITSGFKPADAIIAAAKSKGVTILTTSRDTASATQLIRGSRPIMPAVSKDFVSFDPDTPVGVISDRISGLNHTLFPVIHPTKGSIIGVFSRSDLVEPTRTKLILVDHNEFSQAVTGAEEAEIIEVMDHHRLSGNLVTREPVQFINKTVGSTCTIVARTFKSAGIKPTAAIARCMCAGMISDTLNLTSPTTTDEDREILSWIGKIAGIDVDQFTEEFFAAGSLLKSSPPAEAVGSDRKEYTESGYRISISQVEEVGMSHFWPVHEQLRGQLAHLIETKNLDIACLLVTDVTLHNSLLLIEAPEQVIARIGYPRREQHLFELDGVVSRKKQLFPWLSSLLAEIPRATTETGPVKVA